MKQARKGKVPVPAEGWGLAAEAQEREEVETAVGPKADDKGAAKVSGKDRGEANVMSKTAHCDENVVSVLVPRHGRDHNFPPVPVAAADRHSGHVVVLVGRRKSLYLDPCALLVQADRLHLDLA